MSDLFAGIPVSEFTVALPWYEQLFGTPPAFYPHDTEAVWELAEHQYVYIVQSPEHTGHAIVTHMVGNLDALVASITERGIKCTREEYFPNDVCKVTYNDPDGNEVAFGGVRRNLHASAW